MNEIKEYNRLIAVIENEIATSRRGIKHLQGIKKRLLKKIKQEKKHEET